MSLIELFPGNKLRFNVALNIKVIMWICQLN
jgi:hypothetical protein